MPADTHQSTAIADAALQMLHGARHYGFDIKGVSFDWSKIKEMRDAYITKLNNIYMTNVNKAGVDFIAGWAAFVGPKTVQASHPERLFLRAHSSFAAIAPVRMVRSVL